MLERWDETLRAEPPILLTGAAGFIGFHLAARLLDAGVRVVGLDSLTPYYDVSLKHARLDALRRRPNFRFVLADVADAEALNAVVRDCGPRRIIHLAAQAGVRHSLREPQAYVAANVAGFLNVLEACRAIDVAHLVYASSSSVYGGGVRLPFAPDDPVGHPVSLYAATKRAGELMAHAYCHLHGFPATGLRFFTVYGPWGRPDMAYWKFTEAISEGRPIEVFNNGRMGRDFTHVDDVTELTLRLACLPPRPDPDYDRSAADPSRSWAPHRIFNVGATRAESLMDMIAIIERAVGRPAQVRFAPMQPGDVENTRADMTATTSATGYAPRVALRDGLERFVAWWRDWRAEATRAGSAAPGPCGRAEGL